MNYPDVKYINEAQVETLLMRDLQSYLDYLEHRISKISDGGSSAWIKPKMIYDDPVHPDKGDIRSMTCFTDKVKVIKIISTNPLRNKHWSVSVGASLLLDYEENYPIAIFDATMMSAIRTAAMAIIGAMFSGADLEDTLILGYGYVGSCAAEILKHKITNSVRVVDPGRCGDPADNVVFSTTLERYEASSIIAATTSRKVLLDANNTRAGFIVSLGADTAFNFELDDDLIRRREGLFVDCFDAVHVGDLSRMDDARSLIKGDVLDLYRHGRSAKTLISVGSPLMDALTIEFMALNLDLI